MGVPADLLRHVREYLVGPGAGDEVISDRPTDAYTLGLLFPAGAAPEQEDLDAHGPASGEGGSGDGRGLPGAGHGSDDAPESEHARRRAPSSIGLQCRVAAGAGEISAEARFATYEKTESGWKRIPASLAVPVRGSGEETIRGKGGNALARLTWRTEEGEGGGPPGPAVMSVFLSNAMGEHSVTGPGSRDARCTRVLFQASIRLEGGEGSFADAGATTDRRLLMPDEIPLEMLYRGRKVYARGFGCSADWDRNGALPRFVSTEHVPHYQSRWIEFGSEASGDRPGPIDMVDVEEAPDPQALYDLLKDIPEKYSRWILAEASAAREIDDDFRGALDENVRSCNRARDRIRDGLEMLRDPARRDVYEAFKAANRAMLWQRSRYECALERSKTGRRGAGPPEPTIRGRNAWRPFQVAFLLINLRGMSDAGSDAGRRDRMAADLLWFPTGGGKTEAYLALAAFAMVLRRLRRGDGDGAGVSIIMRYTLRLLTVQQFERAATLICALEQFRRLDPRALGDEPFLIGLWVGGKVTPNTPADSAEALKDHDGGATGAGSPSQLVFCPWCGSDMSQKNYRVDERRTEWTVARCLDPGCDFYSEDPLDAKRALPILTVDFDIYRRCPSMVIATVDKFARLPWKAEAASLFGIVERKCGRCGYLTHASDHGAARHRESGGGGTVEDARRLDPPDMIIQDELHLITGPLGTMVGLYETAVDYLCAAARGGPRPKIVASTATVRGAETQLARLFDRKDTCVFPSPVARPDDMFFWRESGADGRLYAGVSFSHRSAMFTLARLSAVLLQRAYEIRAGRGGPDEADPYWTLVAYFNSIRELGAARRLVEDDVHDNIGQLARRRPGVGGRKVSDTVEITGRVGSQKIREVRKRLDLDSSSKESIDVLLATSMISVGIDVERMGLMIIKGQPKTASEYIQASGRVGRREDIPGAVFTLFNPHKPRDMSHYEGFVGDHLKLQQAVEPAGLTPFSDPAVDRAIHAVMIAMVRLSVPGMSGNGDAERLDHHEAEIGAAKDAILGRFCSVENEDRSGERCRRLKSKLDALTGDWSRYVQDAHRYSEHVFYADDGMHGRYGNAKRKNRVLMKDFAAGVRAAGPFPRPTPGSLRDVEVEAGLFYGRAEG